MNVLKVSMAALVVCGGMAMAQSPAPTVVAPEPVGRVKTLTGTATISSPTSNPSQTVAAEVGTPLFLGSTIKTEKNASLGLTFKDGTVLSLGSDTRLTVDAFLFDPNQNQYQFGIHLGKGVLHYLSGAIAKARPDGVSVKTPTAVIGVRGTHFVVKAEELP